MLIRHRNQGFEHPLGSEITPQPQYLQRRDFLQTLVWALRARPWQAGPAVTRWLRPIACIYPP